LHCFFSLFFVLIFVLFCLSLASLAGQKSVSACKYSAFFKKKNPQTTKNILYACRRGACAREGRRSEGSRRCKDFSQKMGSKTGIFFISENKVPKTARFLHFHQSAHFQRISLATSDGGGTCRKIRAIFSLFSGVKA